MSLLSDIAAADFLEALEEGGLTVTWTGIAAEPTRPNAMPESVTAEDREYASRPFEEDELFLRCLASDMIGPNGLLETADEMREVGDGTRYRIIERQIKRGTPFVRYRVKASTPTS